MTMLLLAIVLLGIRIAIAVMAVDPDDYGPVDWTTCALPRGDDNDTAMPN